MTQAPRGWFPDPYPAAPSTPPQLRYWDGEAWTEHVAPAPAQQYGQQYGQQPGPYAVPSTPDGQELAGWWARVGAYLIDYLILLPFLALVYLAFWHQLSGPLHDFFDQLDTANANGSTPPSAFSLQRDLLPVLALIGFIGIVMNFVYQVGFLMWKQATPGKLLLGLRVRLRETPGPMPLGTVLMRWLTQFGVQLFGLVPFVGSFTGLYRLLDDLWPLWDSKRQALHDKAAKTNVVKVR